ncbi:MAG: substrate-binding domain-containing protein [Chloroflexota bacterium]
MPPIQPLQGFEQLKLLSDPRRLRILRLLMSAPASLTGLGQTLGEHPAWVRHHLKQLESAGLVELAETRIQSGVVEKFYRARASGFMIQQMILPEETPLPVIVFSGSHDLAVELLVEKTAPYLNLLTMPVGSLDGLTALRQGICHLSGAHLLDTNGEYNLPFVRHFFPDRPIQIVTLAHREQGLMTAPGNPKSIYTMTDLARDDVTIINRNPGSGTRLWLDQQLQTRNIPSANVRGYENSVSTHTEAARLVCNGKADAAIGLRAAAHQYSLGFIPLFHERYDLIIPQDQLPLVAPLLETIQTGAYRRSVESLTGYETTHTGEQIPI